MAPGVDMANDFVKLWTDNKRAIYQLNGTAPPIEIGGALQYYPLITPEQAQHVWKIWDYLADYVVYAAKKKDSTAGARIERMVESVRWSMYQLIAFGIQSTPGVTKVVRKHETPSCGVEDWVCLTPVSARYQGKYLPPAEAAVLFYNISRLSVALNTGIWTIENIDHPVERALKSIPGPSEIFVFWKDVGEKTARWINQFVPKLPDFSKYVNWSLYLFGAYIGYQVFKG